MKSFRFELGQRVVIHGNETGNVIARAEYLHSENCYQIRYRAGDGRSVEAWWGESALDPHTN